MNANAQTNEPDIDNGLNVDDLFALIEGVKGDASKATTSWRVATTWQGQTRSRAEVEGFSIGGQDVSRRFTIDIRNSLARHGRAHAGRISRTEAFANNDARRPPALGEDPPADLTERKAVVPRQEPVVSPGNRYSSACSR